MHNAKGKGEVWLKLEEKLKGLRLLYNSKLNFCASLVNTFPHHKTLAIGNVVGCQACTKNLTVALSPKTG